MALCASVVIDDIINKIDKPYDYVVPSEFLERLKVGMRVVVPFSKANIKKKALVILLHECDDASAYKQIIDVVDSEVLINRLQMSLIRLLKNRYFVTYYNALKAIVPRGIDFKITEYFACTDELEQFDNRLFLLFRKKNNRLKYNDVPDELKANFDQCRQSGLVIKQIVTADNIGRLTEKYLTLNISTAEVENYISQLEKRFSKQKDLLSVFLDCNEVSERDALYYSGCGTSTVKTLEKKGIITIKRKLIERNPYKDIERTVDMSLIQLTGLQQQIYDSVKVSMNEYAVHLIHGVTGSGKTLIYMSLIDRIVKQDKSAIFMVPEISLTPQTLNRFYSRYGDKVSVIHSGLAPGERADQWRKVKNCSSSVVVGTRSAVFAPVNNLGIIIIDEEHEQSYKSESSPRYHARDISKFICKKLNIPLVLGSATPSIESSYFAKKGKYKYYKLDKRFNNNPLPHTSIIDMRNSFKQGNQSFLSEELRLAIEENLHSGGQTILFLNRRGAYTMVGCRSCGYVAKCKNCGIALTYHSANNRCMCHYCGYSIKMFDTCPVCKGKHIKRLGIGTQLVNTELEEFFPTAKILRMDYDTVSSYISYGNSLDAFRKGEYNIMVGTQMVAKGLDFPNVTLVGVINADLSLFVDDFRANERTFSLLTQVCGRSGRAGKEGRALIQTYSPDHEIIRYAKDQDYDKYYDFEIKFRQAMNYPPFCDLILFNVTNSQENLAYSDVQALYTYIDQISRKKYNDIPVRLLYPTVPKIAYFNGKYRYKLVIKSKICNRMYQMLWEISNYFEDNVTSALSINVNPMNNN